VIYEIRVTAEDQDNHQIFSLEGSLDVLRDFFDAGRALVEETMERGGKTENVGVATIGPPARLQDVGNGSHRLWHRDHAGVHRIHWDPGPHETLAQPEHQRRQGSLVCHY
jgi:hypothetical protein